VEGTSASCETFIGSIARSCSAIPVSMAVLDNLIAQAQNGADLQQLLRIFKQSENTLHHQGSQAGGAALLQASLALDLTHHSLACLHILCAIHPSDAPWPCCMIATR